MCFYKSNNLNNCCNHTTKNRMWVKIIKFNSSLLSSNILMKMQSKTGNIWVVQWLLAKLWCLLLRVMTSFPCVIFSAFSPEWVYHMWFWVWLHLVLSYRVTGIQPKPQRFQSLICLHLYQRMSFCPRKLWDISRHEAVKIRNSGNSWVRMRYKKGFAPMKMQRKER